MLHTPPGVEEDPNTQASRIYNIYHIWAQMNPHLKRLGSDLHSEHGGLHIVLPRDWCIKLGQVKGFLDASGSGCSTDIGTSNALGRTWQNLSIYSIAYDYSRFSSAHVWVLSLSR